MTKAKQYDTVVLLESINGFQKGEKGAVVEVYTTPYEAYDIEIVTDEGMTKGLIEAIRPEQIEVIPAISTEVGLKIEITAKVNITAFVAQQKVTQFVISEISNQLCGDKPDLNIGEHLCWSVPVILTSPAKGTIGRVGEILVDADTGELLADADVVERIDANAEWLAKPFPL